MKYSDLQAVVEDQRIVLLSFELGTIREILPILPVISSHALVVTGIHRCGKSVLLHQFIQKETDQLFYLNFADIRLFGFTTSDFILLDELIKSANKKILYFDEIQIVHGWELFVRQFLDRSFRILITGSNARMLSKELGSNLTGRHISKELFPFNFNEFCAFFTFKPDRDSFLTYLERGGFPEFLKSGNKDVLSFLFEDIIYRDIVVRYSIRDVSGLKNLGIYLMTNFARLISPSKLTSVTGIKSASTVLEYFSYFESCYLINMIPRFFWSVKAQVLSEKKVYVVDNGIINVASISASKDLGRKLENVVYWMIRRKTKNIWYFSDGHSECDFVFKKEETYHAIQVCYDLNGDTQEREIIGLKSALKFFNLTEGTIVTLDQRDLILTEGLTITVKPVWEWHMEGNFPVG